MARKAQATADTEQRATVAAVVRRFQGSYECGCTVDRDLPQPTECVLHEMPAVYKNEDIHIDNVEVGPGFDEIFREV